MKKYHIFMLLTLTAIIGLSAATSWTAGGPAKGADAYFCAGGPDCKCNTVSTTPANAPAACL